MPTIKRDQYSYVFRADVPPVLSVDPGTRVIAETWDSTTGRLFRTMDNEAYNSVRNPLKVNPAAGPVFVRGAKPGQSLTVLIERIEVGQLGSVRIPASGGLLPDVSDESAAIPIQTNEGMFAFGTTLQLPLRPMVGVVGTAPAVGETPTALPGDLGSNMDLNIIREGSVVHLPVEVPGGLLGVGDVHASMGNGEISGSAVEIPATVTYTVDIEADPFWPHLWIETEDLWACYAHSPTLDDAVARAARELTYFLAKRLGLSGPEAYMLVSARGDLQIGQHCKLPGLNATAYATFPKIRIDGLRDSLSN